MVMRKTKNFDASVSSYTSMALRSILMKATLTKLFCNPLKSCFNGYYLLIYFQLYLCLISHCIVSLRVLLEDASCYYVNIILV